MCFTKKRAACLGVVTAVALTTLPAVAQKPDSYREAKAIADSIYHDYPVTLYCSCLFDLSDNNDTSHKIDLDTCGVNTQRYRNRMLDTEWEHVMPASYFGSMLPCWSQSGPNESGREHCADTSPSFNAMAGDLYNLQPSVGAINAIRSNHPYGLIPGERRVMGQCDFEDNGRVAEPAPWIRGDVARSWFYMRDTYGIPITDAMTRLLQQWARQDPPDLWEKTRARRIGRIQGDKYTVHFPE